MVFMTAMNSKPGPRYIVKSRTAGPSVNISRKDHAVWLSDYSIQHSCSQHTSSQFSIPMLTHGTSQVLFRGGPCSWYRVSWNPGWLQTQWIWGWLCTSDSPVFVCLLFVFQFRAILLARQALYHWTFRFLRKDLYRAQNSPELKYLPLLPPKGSTPPNLAKFTFFLSSMFFLCVCPS